MGKHLIFIGIVFLATGARAMSRADSNWQSAMQDVYDSCRDEALAAYAEEKGVSATGDELKEVEKKCACSAEYIADNIEMSDMEQAEATGNMDKIEQLMTAAMDKCVPDKPLE